MTSEENKEVRGQLIFRIWVLMMRNPARAVFFMAFSVRCAYIFGFQTYNEFGSAEMIRSAISLAEHGAMADIFSEHSGPTAHVAPLYALFLSGIYRIFGAFTPLGRLVQQLAASLVSSLAIALLVRLGIRSGLRPASGLVAAILGALLPLNLWVETSGSWEQPFSALLLVSLLLAFIRLRESQWKDFGHIILVGVLVGVSALLSPCIVVGAVFCVCAELLAGRSLRKRVLTGGVVIGIISALIISPWVYRNYCAFGRFVPMRSDFGLEFWIGNNPAANGTAYPLVDELHPSLNKQESALITELGEVEYSRRKLNIGLGWVRDHPAQFVFLTLDRFRMYWFPSSDMWANRSRFTWGKVFLRNLVGFGACVGMICLWWRRHPYREMFLAVFLGVCSVYTITIVEIRYSYPVYGIMLLLGCHFVCGVRLLRFEKGVIPKQPPVVK